MTINPDITIRPLTKGPMFHWFGYYDKQQFDANQRYVLAMQVGFEGRRPNSDDTIKIGLIDLTEGDKWHELGQSRAWCWQMGCMLQWRPGSQSEIMWNDRQDNLFVSHILDIHTGKKKTLPFPFFSLHPSGKLALSLDFERLEYMRPGYGYAGIPDRNRDILAPEDMGIYLIDIENQTRKLIVSLAQLASIPHKTYNLADSQHYCNCLQFNPDGSRFVFLHRWRPDRGKAWPFKTRMITAKPDGTDLYVLVEGGCGHFTWRDSEHLLVQENGFFIYKDKFGRTEQVGKDIIPNSGGHISYLPDKSWIVGDTYPDKNRLQSLYLYHITDNKLITLGSFLSPLTYTGSHADNCDDEWRCDLHPRLSPKGNLITIDSPHGGNGRQLYLVDISAIIHT